MDETKSVVMDDVLCPGLYFSLKRRFKVVRVSNRGMPYIAGPVRQGGEQYHVNCPYCGESRFRLYFGHNWLQNIRQATCFNEGCTEGEIGYQRMLKLSFELTAGSGYADFSVRAASPSVIESQVDMVEMRPPDFITNLKDLPDDHYAAEYITGRGYDKNILGTTLGVGYIDGRAIPMHRNRIYIPVSQGGKLMGYQLRIVSEDPLRRQQKYVNAMGMRKSRLLYNIDVASTQSAVVIVEGPADVWSIGPSGIAIFGSDCSDHQLTLIGERLSDKVIIVALDGDAKTKAIALTDKIRLAAPRASVLMLPLGPLEDPGALKSEFWIRVQAQTSVIRDKSIKILTEWQ